MKFICVSCDTQMKLEETTGPVEGSLSVTFACPHCAHRTALLTNPSETQLVRALDVKIGGRSGSPEPMEFVRAMLASGQMGAMESTGDTAPSTAAEDSAASTELGTGSRCPFSAVANQAAEMATIPWEPSAERRLDRVPEFIRPMARQGIERFAAEHGYPRITEEIIEKVRDSFGL
ncbi:MAG: PCP reductase family protein, partial [Candidatus Tectimicrobiota bacterium]